MADWEAILIAGPTASGKSGLALNLAEALGGTIVNADALQVYDGLSILTARPDGSDLLRAPHRLYGHVPPSESYSAGRYVRELEALLATLRGEASLPILCGGTGLYFKALLGLLDEMPPVPPALRESWRARLASEGAASLHRLLAERDPASAERIDAADGQRIVRALEIGDAAGRPMSTLRLGRGPALLDPARCLKVVLAPERSVLRARIAQRFETMMAAGALGEVRRFRDAYGAEALGTAQKAIGFAELAAVLDGEGEVESAIGRAITRTRQYAKRQETWFRHQFDETWMRLHPDEALDAVAAAISGIPVRS